MRCYQSRYLGFLLLMLCLGGCESMLFFPQKTLIRTPDHVGLKYEDVVLSRVDGPNLHGWWLPAIGDAKATILFAHGNAENISTHIASVYWMPARGLNVLLVDYRGYGLSQGIPSVSGAVADMVLAAQEAERRSVTPDLPWYALGQSLGATLIANAVVEGDYPHLAGVVLDAGFSEFSRIAQDVAARHWLTWLFQYPAAWSMPDGYDLLPRVGHFAPLPVLFFHGRRDPVVGYEHVEHLYDAALQPKELQVYDGGHIETFNFDDNRAVLLRFIEGHAPRR